MSPNLKQYADGHWGKRSEITCTNCLTLFHGRDAFKRHLVQYAWEPGFWCHLPVEVGLVSSRHGWELPTGRLYLDPGITRGGGHPQYESGAISRLEDRSEGGFDADHS
jgi:hypothetical protein